MFLDEFKHKIVECHISILKDWHHTFTHLSNVDELMKEFSKKIKTDVILVNESVVWNLNQVKYFKDELEYLRNL